MLLSSYLQVTTDISPQKAEAELAYELQAAKTKQRIKEENMQIKVTSTCTCTLCSSVCDPSGDREEPGDRDPGAGDRQEGEGAGELHQEASGGREVQAGEDGGGTQVIFNTLDIQSCIYFYCLRSRPISLNVGR